MFAYVRRIGWTPMSQEDVEMVRHLWEAAERRDEAGVFALYAPGIVWESRYTGSLEGGGIYYGHEGVRRFFRDWLEAFETYEALGAVGSSERRAHAEP
jgi:ketosteroid isomerase-like protein